MKEASFNYSKHVFVCVNERESGDCCKNNAGVEMYMKLKNYIKAHGLTSDVWVTRTGCLGFCNPVGTTVVIYPQGKWFLDVTPEDITTITKELH